MYRRGEQSQILKNQFGFDILNFGHLNLFGICVLLFGIYSLSGSQIQPSDVIVLN